MKRLADADDATDHTSCVVELHRSHGTNAPDSVRLSSLDVSGRLILWRWLE